MEPVGKPTQPRDISSDNTEFYKEEGKSPGFTLQTGELGPGYQSSSYTDTYNKFIAKLPDVELLEFEEVEKRVEETIKDLSATIEMLRKLSQQRKTAVAMVDQSNLQLATLDHMFEKPLGRKELMELAGENNYLRVRRREIKDWLGTMKAINTGEMLESMEKAVLPHLTALKKKFTEAKEQAAMIEKNRGAGGTDNGEDRK
jgi:hypothetical protein